MQNSDIFYSSTRPRKNVIHPESNEPIGPNENLFSVRFFKAYRLFYFSLFSLQMSTILTARYQHHRFIHPATGNGSEEMNTEVCFEGNFLVIFLRQKYMINKLFLKTINYVLIFAIFYKDYFRFS